MKNLSLILLGILAILSAVIVIRSARFTSRQIHAEPIQSITLDREAVARRLSKAIQFKTISFQEPADPGSREFIGLRVFIEKSFPLVHRRLTKEIVGGYSLVYAWAGQDTRLKPILLMAHMDVVLVDPTTESAWHHPPFSGDFADGYIWGRGAIDDKASVMGILEAVENLLAKGFQPQRTVYLAFGHDEEIGGARGAAKIAELLRSRGVELEYVLDEGLNIFTGIIPGVTASVALIGVAEKGYLSLQLTVETAGGHSSAPPRRTAIGIISRAIQRLEARPFPSRLSGPTRQMLEFLGPEMAWYNKLALANLWLFGPLVRKQLAASPLTNAAIRTTVAPTLFNAGVKDNVLPAKATAVINLRLAPGETIDGATAHVQATIGDPNVKITPLPVQIEPSNVSDIESPSFALLHRTIRETAPQSLVAPALLVAATDSRHYRALSGNIFRFLPIILGAEDAKRIHGVDERISIEDYERCIRFYAQLIRNSQSS